MENLAHDWPTIEHTVRGYVEGPNNPFFTHLPASAQQWIMKLPSQVSVDVQRNAAAYTGKVVNALEIVVGIAAVAIAIPVVSIYMLAESSIIKGNALDRGRSGLRRHARSKVLRVRFQDGQIVVDVRRALRLRRAAGFVSR